MQVLFGVWKYPPAFCGKRATVRKDSIRDYTKIPAHQESFITYPKTPLVWQRSYGYEW